MAQQIKCLPCNYENLSLIPNTHMKEKLSVAAHAYKAQCWEGRGRWIPRAPEPSSLADLVSSSFREDHVSKRKVGND